MKKVITIVLAIFLASISSVNAQDLNKVLDQYFEVAGMEKLLEIKNTKTTGIVQQFGMENKYLNYFTADGKYYLEVPIQGQLMKQVYDGENAWMVAPWTGSLDPVPLTGAQLKEIKIQADMLGPLYDYKKKGYKTELAGKDDLEGTEVYVIKQVDDDGDEFIHYIDAENFVVLKMTNKMHMNGNEMITDTYFSNYDYVDDILGSFNIEVKVNGKTQTQIIVESVEYDVDVDDSLFEKPVVEDTDK